MIKICMYVRRSEKARAYCAASKHAPPAEPEFPRTFWKLAAEVAATSAAAALLYSGVRHCKGLSLDGTRNYVGAVCEAKP